MTGLIKKSRWAWATLLIVSIAAGCAALGEPGTGESTDNPATAPRRILQTIPMKVDSVSQNGIWQNGLSTNGIWQNGIWQNGIWQNGIWQNGIWQNGIWQNGIWQNGIWQNGIWQNGIWQNGLGTNGIWQNGIWQNGIWQNGIWQNGLAATTLQQSQYARQLLQYIYACAMPAPVCPADGGQPNSDYDTTLDPNSPSIACTPSSAPCDVCPADGADAVGCGLSQGSCDPGYVCAPTYADAGPANTCVVPLRGLIGLGINADGTHWWDRSAAGDAGPSDAGAGDGGASEAGTCDESCQRWISACVLARTNAYGVHVNISMRAPATPPNATPGRASQFGQIQAALAVSNAERNGTDDAGTGAYSLREGAYYGNIFATTPANPAPAQAYSGPAAGPVAETPSFYACAGPGSNIPEITKRFCSSQGDQVVINVPGVCLTRATDAGTTLEKGACAGEDTTPGGPTSGSIQGCAGGGKTYDEVITVFLQQPIAVCGNGVCESGEGDPSKPMCSTNPGTSPCSCPSDCHPQTWATTFGQSLLDDPSPPTRPISNAPVAYRIDAFARPHKVAVGAGGSVVIADVVFNSPPLDLDGDGDPTTNVLSGTAGEDLVLAQYDTTGKYQGGLRSHLTVFDSAVAPTLDAVTVGSDGSIIVVGTTGTVAGNPSLAVISDLWVAKFTPTGDAGATTWTPAPGWPVKLGDGPGIAKSSIHSVNVAVDSAGDIGVVGSYSGTATFGSFSLCDPTSTAGCYNPSGTNAFIAKLWPDGSAHLGGPVAWASEEPTYLSALAFEPGGDVVATGTDGLLKLDAINGHLLGAVGYTRPTTPDSASGFRADGVAIDSSGDIYVAGAYQATDPDNGGTEVEISKYAGGGPDAGDAGDGGMTYLWSTDVSQGQGQSLGSYLGLDAFGDVVVAGIYASNVDFGSGLFDDYKYPNVFVAAYATTDSLASGQSRLRWAKQVPFVLDGVLSGFAVDGKGHVVLGGAYSGSMQMDDQLLVNTIPEDTNHRNMFIGRFCAPSPLCMTPPTIGAATDQSGQPIDGVSKNIVAQATSSAGACVFFMPPTAIDNCGGASGDAGDADQSCGAAPPGVTVTCSPPPNTTFPLTCPAAGGGTGASPCTTTVTCTASDPFGNSSTASFTVTVVDQVPPVFSLYAAPAAVQATSGTGASVSFPLPTASDQVDNGNTSCSSCGAPPNPPPQTCAAASGTLPVTCTLPSGVCQNGTCTGQYPVGTTPVTCTATDARGNQSQMTFSVVVNPAPISTSCVGTAASPLVVPMTAGTCGVTVTSASGLAGSCGGAGLASCTLGGQGSVTLAPGTQSLTVMGTGVDGSTTSCTSYLTVIDNQNPTIECANETVQCTGNGSATATPTASCSDPCGCTASCATGTFPLGTSQETCSASDPSGNTASCQGTVQVVDTLPPVVTPAPGPSQLQCNADTWTDPGATATDQCAGNVSPSVKASGTVDPTRVGSYALTYSATDPSGNVGSATRSVAVIDTLAPSLALPGTISATPTSASGVTVTYAVSATDRCVGPVTATCAPGSGSTFPPGTTAVTCTASDPAGNMATGSFPVQVQYSWSGILQPVNADGSSVFKLGSTVPVQFQLTGASAGITNLAATLTLAKISSTVVGTDLEAVSTSAATTGNAFRYDSTSGQYIFNLATKSLSKGSWQLSVNLQDGVSRTVMISLR